MRGKRGSCKLRGDYLNTGEAASSGTPAVLHSFLDDRLPGNRLGLAKWLVAPEKIRWMSRVVAEPLVGVVQGQGIVSTQEDFGTQGEAPTHPGLLIGWRLNWSRAVGR